MKFKAIVTRKGTKYQTFMVYNQDYKEWFECDTPQLFPTTSSIEGLKKFMPDVNFDELEMVDVNLELN